MSQLHVGIVGAGLIARDHANALHREPACDSITFYDIQAESAASAAAACGARTAPSIDALVAACDVVWICTPPFARRDAIAAACAAGKPIFCEKPLGLTAAELDWVGRQVTDAGVPFFMGQSGRYSDFFVVLQRLVAAGAIGAVTHAWSTRLGYLSPEGQPAWRFDDQRGGGVLVELGVHELDFIRWVAGDFASVSAVTPPAILRPGQFQDSLQGVGRMRGGASASLSVSWSSPRYLWQRGVDGSEGSLFFDDSNCRQVQLLRPGREPELHPAGDWIDRDTRVNLSLRDQSRDILARLLDGRPPAVTLADGAAAVRAALAMRQAAAENRVVTL